MFDGILVILETMLVLALTFVALASAAASLAGIILRLTRRRASGYRNLIEYLFRNDIAPLVERLVSGAVSRGDASEAALADLKPIYDYESKAAYAKARYQFLVDMTLNPVPKYASGDPRLKLFEGREPIEGWGESWLGLRNLFIALGRWNCLGQMLNGSTVAEFRKRFRGSEVGLELESLRAKWSPNDDRAYEKVVDEITLQFEAYQPGSTSWFKGVARFWSVPVGFVLAFGLNIDTIDLFKTYLGSPDTRAEILARQEAILGGELLDGETPEQQGARADASSRFIDIQAKIAQVEAIAERIDDETVARKAEEAAAVLSEIARETRVAAEQTAVIARTLESTFPIGWERFPGCEKPRADPRCQKNMVKNEISQNIRIGGLVGLSWFLGVLVTGLMIGLGAPFWVEVVNNILQTRQLIVGFRDVLRSKPK